MTAILGIASGPGAVGTLKPLAAGTGEPKILLEFGPDSVLKCLEEEFFPEFLLSLDPLEEVEGPKMNSKIFDLHFLEQSWISLPEFYEALMYFLEI